jgi:hypothetical protein
MPVCLRPLMFCLISVSMARSPGAFAPMAGMPSAVGGDLGDAGVRAVCSSLWLGGLAAGVATTDVG